MNDKYVLRKNKCVKVSDVIDWAKEFEIMNRIVKQETIKGKFVSTVFLGIDHNFYDGGKPLLFETMIFPSKENMTDEYCERCTTWEEAEEQHKKAVESLSK